MKKYRWILYVSSRYFNTKRKDKNLSTALFSVLGISVGVMVMITILGVMNGLQMGFIEDILQINSFHLRINTVEKRPDYSFLSEAVTVPGVKSILPFIDVQTLGKGRYSEFKACVIRGVPEGAEKMDPDLIKYLGITKGSFDLSGTNSIVLGSVYASSLGVTPGDEVSLVSMAGSTFNTLSPIKKSYIVKGIFKSGFYEYDSSMGFTSLDNLYDIASGKENITYGIKLFNRYKDSFVKAQIRSKMDKTMKIVSWREYNRAFFGALRMEKISLILIVGLIFIVVGVNIKHSLERSVYKRREDIGLLRSLGATPGSVKIVFVLEGALVGFLGGVIGVLTGLGIAININGILSFLSDVTSYFLVMTTGASTIVPFYLSEVPVRLVFHEIFLVLLFAFFSSVIAAYRAASQISNFNPAEILRYE